MQLEGKTVFHKLWFFLRTYILTIPRFDLFLQGALLIVVLLETNIFLLMRRDVGTGFLPSMIEEWVYVGSGVAEFVFGAALGWFGRSRRQLALTGWLGATAVSSLLVLAFPYEGDSTPRIELCGGETIAPYSEVSTNFSTARVIFLIISSVLCSLTMISIWAHGLSYLDDHEPQNGAYFYGILISIRLSLGLSGQNWLSPGSVREDWWEAHLSLSMLTLMFAILFTFFPKRMPNLEIIENHDDSGNSFFKATSNILRNKVIMVQSCAVSLLYVAIFSFVKFDKFYVQARFQVESVRQDPQTSRSVSDIFRSMVVIFFVMIFRMRFSVRRPDGVKSNTAAKVGGVVAIFVAIVFGVLAFLPCNLDDVDGIQNGVIEPPACSLECGCNSQMYGFTPVCAVDSRTTYFSPCHAGCGEYENLNGFLVFSNCTCGSGRAVRGSCSLPSCRTSFNFYQIFYTLVIAVTGSSLLMQGMVILRAVQRHEKSLALGVSFAIVGLVQVPGHLLYMLISDLTCAFKGVDGGACIYHTPTLWTMAAASAGFALCSAIISLITSSFKEHNRTVIVHSNDK